MVLSGKIENSSQVAQILKVLDDVEAVIAAGEFSVEMAEIVSEQLGLKRSMDKPANILRNKAIMRAEFSIYGVNQPKVIGLASSVDDLKKLAEKVSHYPVISKAC